MLEILVGVFIVVLLLVAALLVAIYLFRNTYNDIFKNESPQPSSTDNIDSFNLKMQKEMNDFVERTIKTVANDNNIKLEDDHVKALTIKYVSCLASNKIEFSDDNAAKNKISREIYAQLDSTYDDAPVDEKRWKPGDFYIRALHRILSCFGVFRGDFKHDDITIKVYRRLLLRHSILNNVEKMSLSHNVNKCLGTYPNGILTKKSLQSFMAEKYVADKDKSSQDKDFAFSIWKDKKNSLRVTSLRNTDIIEGDIGKGANDVQDESCAFSFLPPGVRAYNLAVTDLFVEKALSYLNRKARTYNKYGFILAFVAFAAIMFGTFVALANTLDDKSNGSFSKIVKEYFLEKKSQDPARAEIPDYLTKYINNMESKKDDPYASSTAAAEFLKFISSEQSTIRWIGFISAFVRGFTFYGLLVLLAVFCYRMARALFDQAERLKDRRHALRQGRLFVHLNGGKMSVDELEKAFNWNMSSDNAFANINPDAQAPWGNVVKEMLKTIRETSKAGIKAAERKGA